MIVAVATEAAVAVEDVAETAEVGAETVAAAVTVVEDADAMIEADVGVRRVRAAEDVQTDVVAVTVVEDAAIVRGVNAHRPQHGQRRSDSAHVAHIVTLS